WELNLDIDDFDLRLTPVLRPCSSTRVETSTTTQNLVRIIPGLAGIVQAAKLLKQTNIRDGGEGRQQELSQDGKLDHVIAIVNFFTPNVIGKLTVTLKDLSGTIPGTIHHKVIDEEGYEKDIIVVFRKDTVPGSGSGVGWSRMLMEEEEMVKLIKEEMVDLELQGCGNVTDQDEEALNLALEEEARKARDKHEWLKKCRQKEKLDEEHERQPWGFYETV
ncbi:ribonuclease H-like domain-containing protein, partial [Tanacetum coccineum]